MFLSDFVIHIDETLDESDVNEAERAVGACAGVASTHVSPFKPHLMLVAYDPERGRSSQVLGAIRSRS